jgi:hypothetical protein
MRDLYSDKSVLSHLLDSQTPGGQRSEQLGFRFGQVEPSKPIRAFEDHHLTIVDRRYASRHCFYRYRVAEGGTRSPLFAINDARRLERRRFGR